MPRYESGLPSRPREIEYFLALLRPDRERDCTARVRVGEDHAFISENNCRPSSSVMRRDRSIRSAGRAKRGSAFDAYGDSKRANRSSRTEHAVGLRTWLSAPGAVGKLQCRGAVSANERGQAADGRRAD